MRGLEAGRALLADILRLQVGAHQDRRPLGVQLNAAPHHVPAGKSATRVDKDQPNVALSCKYLRINSAMSAVQI